MKKFISIFILIACAMSFSSYGAVNVKKAGVKKAAPVATQQTDKLSSATSLLPTVIGLVGNVKALYAQQQQLSADCAPTSTEIGVVNDLVKELAKTGMVSASSMTSGLGGECYESYKTDMAYADKNFSCYDTFKKSKNKNGDIDYIWDDFPTVGVVEICDAGTNKNCKKNSNIYDIFGKVSGYFDESDYTEAEASKISKLVEKMGRCAPGKLKAAQRELAGNFLTQTLGSVGQSTGAAGTASVLNAVSSMGGSGDIKSMLPSLGQMATQLLDK